MSIDHAPLLDVANHAITTGAKTLSLLLGVEVEFGQPSTLDSEIQVDAGGKLVAVRVSFTGGIQGDTTLAFTSGDAAHMVELLLTGMEYSEDDILGELGMAALGEAMNQFVAGIGRGLGQRTGHPVDTSAPRVEILPTGVQGSVEQDDVVVAWSGTIGPAPAHLYWAMTTDVVDALIAESSPEAPAPGAAHSATPALAHAVAGPPALGRLADVVLDVTVELGRSRIPIKELLALDEGGVIRLGKPIGEPVELLVNGLATARGEIVVVDGRLGLRVTELIG